MSHSSQPTAPSVPLLGPQRARRGADEAPDGAPPGPWTLDAAYRWCERITTNHYENFPVASRLLPSHLRPDIMAIYAFARTADDFSDEPRFEGRRRQALDAWEDLLERCYHHEVAHPVFMALRDTVRRSELPIEPFRALLTAFRMDLARQRYATFTEVLHYCTHSAHPVGQLVLLVNGYRAPALHRYGNDICAALQLTNFLQDLSIDVARGRLYIPEDDLIHFGVRPQDLEAGRSTRELRELVRFWVHRVRALFLRGRPLIRRVDVRLSMELDATWRGGMAILQKIEDRGFDPLSIRPSLRGTDVASIVLRAIGSLARRHAIGRR